MDYRLKAAPLIGKLIVRQKNAQIHFIGQKHTSYPFNQRGIGIGILPLQHQAHFDYAAIAAQFFRKGHFLIDIGPASLDFVNKPFFRQTGKGCPHRFPAHRQAMAYDIFRWELGIVGKLIFINIRTQPKVYMF